MTIGGHIIIHDAVANDYCVAECIESLSGICDRILVVECDSTDNTLDVLRKIALNNPKVVITHHPWVPSRNMQWIRDIVHHTKHLIGTDWYVSMDADEVLSPGQYGIIRQHVISKGHTQTCGVFHRYTFWKDPQHMIPNGIICSHRCPRLGPTPVSLSGDLIDPPHHTDLPVNIWHYGHLRKRDAWARKSVAMHQAACGEVPNHWREAEKGNFNDVENCVPDSQLVPYAGVHPECIHKWLTDRGYHL